MHSIVYITPLLHKPSGSGQPPSMVCFCVDNIPHRVALLGLYVEQLHDAAKVLATGAGGGSPVLGTDGVHEEAALGLDPCFSRLQGLGAYGARLGGRACWCGGSRLRHDGDEAGKRGGEGGLRQQEKAR